MYPVRIGQNIEKRVEFIDDVVFWREAIDSSMNNPYTSTMFSA